MTNIPASSAFSSKPAVKELPKSSSSKTTTFTGFTAEGKAELQETRVNRATKRALRVRGK